MQPAVKRCSAGSCDRPYGLTTVNVYVCHCQYTLLAANMQAAAVQDGTISDEPDSTNKNRFTQALDGRIKLEAGRVAELEGIIARMRAAEFRSQATISSQASRADTTTSRVSQLEQQVLSCVESLHAAAARAMTMHFFRRPQAWALASC